MLWSQKLSGEIALKSEQILNLSLFALIGQTGGDE